METNKVIVLTGGILGIGLSTTVELASHSAKLVIVGLREDLLRRVAKYCEDTSGLKPLTILANINREVDAIRVINETIDHYGRLDVLVNNAAITVTGGIKDTPVEILDRVMKNNTRTVYHITQLAVPHLIRSKGCIINIPAPSPTQPYASAVIYNMCKVALNNFTKSIAAELSADGVTANSINPSFEKPEDLCLEEYQSMFVSEICKNHLMITKGHEIALLISFLVSGEGRDITGATFVLGNNDSRIDQ